MLPSLLLALLFFSQAPFWEIKAPKDWSEEELTRMFQESPWAQTAISSSDRGPVVFLATAEPMREAEQEYHRRHASESGEEGDDPPYQEYANFLSDNEGKVIVLAMRADRKAFADPKEVQAMEDECELRVKGKKLPLIGHFPPTATDPYLRLVFARMVGPDEDQLQFMLYIPGVPDRYREAFFKLSDLKFHGKVEY
jgi:hypothetical protein